MSTYSLFEIQFDDSYYVDNDWEFDYGDSATVLAVVTTELYPSRMRYTARELLNINILVSIEGDLNAGIALDLLPLIPAKFHQSQMLRDYVDSLEIGVGSWLGKIDDLRALVDPYSVGVTYIGFLADLIGLEFINRSSFTIQQLRTQLLGAIEWYRLKGTYSALELIARIHGLNIIIYDMYTNDYATFVDVAWFVADYPEENPPGLDSSYYKSPHFGYEIQLTTLYGSGSSSYLWIDSMYEGIPNRVEQVRPANTVPHVRAILYGITYEDYQVYATSVNVYTVITPAWEPVSKFFDENPEWHVDDTYYFDQSNTTFVEAVTRFKLGTGNKGVIPYSSYAALESVVYEGTVDSVTVSSDRVVYQCTVPAALAIAGCSELGLFLSNNTTMVCMSTFPDTDKTAGLELRLQITIYR